ncbi:MAG: sigma-70 family RNA polymerase sigma factor [Phycisphaerales bacterium]|nr:sigma-70 family RNA polymerase sigma factor [Phycisphaerales bacterium]
MGGAAPRPTEGSIDLIGVVRAARNGDEGAWGTLVGEYGPRVFALARSRLRSPDLAEEVMQSVFATIAIKLRDGAYDEHGKFEPWLFRIAMNRIRDTVRKAKREGSEDRLRLAAVREEVVVSADQHRGSAEAMEHLRDALGGLSKPDREIVELRYHAGLSFRQIAELLGEPIGTLLARHHRALRKLRAKLEGDGGLGFDGTELPRAAGEAG